MGKVEGEEGKERGTRGPVKALVAGGAGLAVAKKSGFTMKVLLLVREEYRDYLPEEVPDGAAVTEESSKNGTS